MPYPPYIFQSNTSEPKVVETLKLPLAFLMADWEEKFNEGEDEGEEEEGSFQRESEKSTDTLLCLIDCNESMFQPIQLDVKPESGDVPTGFNLAMRAVDQMLRQDLVASNKDKMGVIFYNCVRLLSVLHSCLPDPFLCELTEKLEESERGGWLHACVRAASIDGARRCQCAHGERIAGALALRRGSGLSGAPHRGRGRENVDREEEHAGEVFQRRPHSVPAGSRWVCLLICEILFC